MQIDTAAISEEEQKGPDFQRELADFQKDCDALENDPKQKFRLCVHEAGHIVYIRRIGWTVKELHGPYMYRDADGKLRKVNGAVTPVRGETDDFIAIVKTDIAGFVLVEALTGESQHGSIISNDMRILTGIEASK